MLRIIVVIFFILHGAVHLLYLGQSARLFEMQPGMVWPDGSWAFSKFLGGETTKALAILLLAAAAAGFIAGAVGILARQAWWSATVAGAAVFSAAIYLLLWDGGWEHVDDKGGVGLLINLAIVVAVLAFRWPDFGF